MSAKRKAVIERDRKPPWAPATIDLNKGSTLATFKIALAKAPKAVLESAQTDGRVAQVFWDAFVATKGGSNIPKFDTCRRCKAGFDITENKKDSCVWHYGNLLVDGDIWTEYYESEEAPSTRRKTKSGIRRATSGTSERITARWPREVSDRRAAPRGPPPSKKRKVNSVQTQCRNCGELYDETKNTRRVCAWHDIDAVRRVTGGEEDGGDDSDGSHGYYSDNEDSERGDDSDDERTIQWTCCGSNKKGGGCIVTPHLPPRMETPKEPAEV
ncbi:hypothetical protein DFH07DRAFT_972655 [Mycena maculata]|uniref:Uncharacterized protein n=1 Tax=Mycena maculata TaxID=230809 RepID=A0AAD7HGJ7_9AGAR|nr:hypothetical protein DFH07DRAFT_972655 [Mycena maculata]